jgi:hypothetical protein
MGQLKTSIQESIKLPNSNEMVIVNTKTIDDVNQITRRVDTIYPQFSGSGIEIARFVDSEEQQVAGSFVKDTVKYIRITNLNTTIPCYIYLIKTNVESTVLTLDAGKSLMFSNGLFIASNATDYVQETYADQLYYSDFTSYDVMKAKASGSAVQLEYLIASS